MASARIYAMTFLACSVERESPHGTAGWLGSTVAGGRAAICQVAWIEATTRGGSSDGNQSMRPLRAAGVMRTTTDPVPTGTQTLPNPKATEGTLSPSCRT
jgi:hypothetical protein